MKLENKVGFFDLETGEIISKELVDKMKKDLSNEKIKKIIKKLEKDPNSLSLDEIELLMKIGKRSFKIQLDFKRDSYFIIKKNDKLLMELDSNTVKIVTIVSQMISHDGRIKYNNNKTINTFEELRKYFNITTHTWKKKVKPEIEKYKIIKKENVDNKKCLLFNPAYAIHPDFIMTPQIYDLFKIDILESIHFLLNTIIDKETFDYIKEDIKPLITEFEYSKLEFEVSNDSYVVINNVMDSAGIYILYDTDGEIMYIGKSKNIKNRIVQHKVDKEIGSVKSIIFKDEGNINLYEPYLINKYKPYLNKEFNDGFNMIELPEIIL